jgi:peptidoglycan/xylan/chitin deacetylase (PgdA/CDA1 family)
MNYSNRLSDDTLAILLFHGVVERDDHPLRNYNRKHLEKESFANILKDIKAQGTALSFDDVIKFHNAGEPYPPKSFVVTFDDGFENNLSVAAPVLADFNIPATVYITTDFVDNNRMSWIDRIEWAIEETASIGLTLPWNSDQIIAQEVDEKRILLDNIRTHIKTDSSADPDELATSIQRQCGLPETWSTDDALDLKLTWPQVRELENDSLFTVGGHTHTHAILSFLDENELADEIDTSLTLLHENAGVGNTHYSYPEGLAHCYSDTVIEALKVRGVECCPTAIDGVNTPDIDLFNLKRVPVV